MAILTICGPGNESFTHQEVFVEDLLCMKLRLVSLFTDFCSCVLAFDTSDSHHYFVTITLMMITAYL